MVHILAWNNLQFQSFRVLLTFVYSMQVFSIQTFITKILKSWKNHVFFLKFFFFSNFLRCFVYLFKVRTQCTGPHTSNSKRKLSWSETIRIRGTKPFKNLRNWIQLYHCTDTVCRTKDKRNRSNWPIAFVLDYIIWFSLENLGGRNESYCFP